MAAILRDDPPELEGTSKPIPLALRRIIDHCLEKAPARRFQDARDVAFALESLSSPDSPAPISAPFAPRNRRTTWLWAAVVAGLMAGAAALGWSFQGGPARPNLIRLELMNPPDLTSINDSRISPNGLHLAFNARDATGNFRIWVRHLNSLGAKPLAGTEGASLPFWSPDSRFIGFMAEGKLKKIDVSGGAAQKICDAPGGSVGSWSPADVILFDGNGCQSIYRVSAAGGVPVVVAKVEPSRKESRLGWPEFLPDGRHFLYMADGEKPDDTVYRVGCLDSTDSTTLAPAQTVVTYAPPGYLLYVRDGTLLAQPFDAKALKIKGEPIPIAENIGTDSSGLARFSVSWNGTLVYKTGETRNKLVWVDRAGQEGDPVGEPGDYHNPAFAPGEGRLTYDIGRTGSGKTNIWIRDLKRKVSSRFSFSAGAFCPLWSPDGRLIVFSVGDDLFEKSVEGQGDERPLVKSDEFKFACDWSHDGRYLAYSSFGKETKWDIWILPLFGDRKPFLFLRTPFAEGWPVFSPDGRFLAYQSNESGPVEIYIQSFPGPGGKWQISTAGGSEPHWRADGRELFYRAPDQEIMAVDIQAGNGITAGTPHPLFQLRLDPGAARNRYLPASDGKRFLTVTPLGHEAAIPTTVVLNWFAELGH
jgi:Tol biopolymer transport system component